MLFALAPLKLNFLSNSFKPTQSFIQGTERSEITFSVQKVILSLCLRRIRVDNLIIEFDPSKLEQAPIQIQPQPAYGRLRLNGRHHR